MTPSQICALADSIASKYGWQECRQCATALREAFVKEQLTGSVLRLATQGGRGYIVMKDSNFKLPFTVPQGVDSIADNGQHFGVLIGNQVFDNVFRSGIPFADWQNQFDCDVHFFTVTTIETF